MASLTTIPPEIVEEVILFMDPIQVTAISRCSHLLHSLVNHPKDDTLWRKLYLRQPLDDPRKCVSLLGVPRKHIDWKGELQRLIRAWNVLHHPSLCGVGERLVILRTLIHLLSHVPPLSSIKDNQVSRNHVWITTALEGSSFLDSTALDASEEENQLCARLRTYYGLTRLDWKEATRKAMRGQVYDLRNYTDENVYGPYEWDGRVNWVHVNALRHVVGMHIEDMREEGSYKYSIFPMSLPCTQIVIPHGVDLDEEIDWAGVGGDWRLSICIYDSGELSRYNESENADGELDISILDSPDFREVFRSLAFTLRVTSTIPNDDYPTRPTIRFVGETVGNTTTMRGRVTMCPDDQIQWHFVSGDHQQMVWSSQGVQIGGIRSSFGVLGVWTTVFHGQDDPAGPFWLRKLAVTEGMPMNHISRHA